MEWWDDRAAVLEIVNNAGAKLKELKKQKPDSAFFNDGEIIKAALKTSPITLQYASGTLRNDIEIVRFALSKANARWIKDVYKYAGPVPQADRELVEMAIEVNGEILELAPFKDDRDICMKAVASRGKALQYVDETERDEALVRVAVERNGLALRFAPTELKQDRAIVLIAVQKDGNALEFADSFKTDQEVALAAIATTAAALEHVNMRLARDRTFIVDALKRNGMALEHVSAGMKADSQLVREAVRQNGAALQFAMDSCKRDQTVVLEAVKDCGTALEYADQSMKAHKAVCLAAVDNDVRSLELFDESLKESKEFLLEVMNCTGRAWNALLDEWKQDKDLALAAIRQWPSLRLPKKLTKQHPELEQAVEQAKAAKQAAKQEASAAASSQTPDYSDKPLVNEWFFPTDQRLHGIICDSEGDDVFASSAVDPSNRFLDAKPPHVKTGSGNIYRLGNRLDLPSKPVFEEWSFTESETLVGRMYGHLREDVVNGTTYMSEVPDDDEFYRFLDEDSPFVITKERSIYRLGKKAPLPKSMVDFEWELCNNTTEWSYELPKLGKVSVSIGAFVKLERGAHLTATGKGISGKFAESISVLPDKTDQTNFKQSLYSKMTATALTGGSFHNKKTKMTWCVRTASGSEPNAVDAGPSGASPPPPVLIPEPPKPVPPQPPLEPQPPPEPQPQAGEKRKGEMGTESPPPKASKLAVSGELDAASPTVVGTTAVMAVSGALPGKEKAKPQPAPAPEPEEPAAPEEIEELTDEAKGKSDGGVTKSGDCGVDESWFYALEELFEEEPLAESVYDAIESLKSTGIRVTRLVKVLRAKAKTWKKEGYLKKLGLSDDFMDFALAIYAYTLQNPNVYGAVNGAMFADTRSRDQSGENKLKMVMPYAKFLDTALARLPQSFHFKGLVRRGVPWVFPKPEAHDVRGYFPKGREIAWYEFKSTSTNPEVMTRDHFCGMCGPRTIFVIEATKGYDICKLSDFGEDEAEVLFRPLTRLKVLISINNIVDPSEKVDARKSGHPDMVCLEQLDDQDED